MKAKAWCDGGGNVGVPCSCACVIKIDNGNKVERAIALPHCNTNNESEYEGVLLAIKTALEFEITDLLLYSDSQLVVNQIHGFYKARQPVLQSYLVRVNRLSLSFSSFTIEWVKRTQNQRADELARKVLKPKAPRRNPLASQNKSTSSDVVNPFAHRIK